MLVKVTGASKLYNIGIAELGRVGNEGEIIDVSEERLPILLGKNKKFIKFVDQLSQDEIDYKEMIDKGFNGTLAKYREFKKAHEEAIKLGIEEKPKKNESKRKRQVK